jgi:hypothetical protein
MEPGDAPYYSQQETALQVQYLALLSPQYGRDDPFCCTLHISVNRYEYVPPHSKIGIVPITISGFGWRYNNVSTRSNFSRYGSRRELKFIFYKYTLLERMVRNTLI